MIYSSPVFLGCKKQFLQHHAKIFASWEKIFAAYEFLPPLSKLIFLYNIWYPKFLKSSKDWLQKFFAWWEKISACCKNLHPWFCSLEKPHYCDPIHLNEMKRAHTKQYRQIFEYRKVFFGLHLGNSISISNRKRGKNSQIRLKWMLHPTTYILVCQNVYRVVARTTIRHFEPLLTIF